jgi:molybdopterin-guanine dinucleotide biosynthesis protein A
LVNADIRAPLHVEAITDVILAGMRGSRMGGADKGLQYVQ